MAARSNALIGRPMRSSAAGSNVDSCGRHRETANAGSVTAKNSATGPAPSTRAASYRLGSILAMPVLSRSMQKHAEAEHHPGSDESHGGQSGVEVPQPGAGEFVQTDPAQDLVDRAIDGVQPGPRDAGAHQGHDLRQEQHRARGVGGARGQPPRHRGGDQGEPDLLVACYRNSLALADKHGLLSIAFPCISTGIYGYPFEDAARLALATVREAMAAQAGWREVVFCCFSAGDHRFYEQLLLEVTRP